MSGWDDARLTALKAMFEKRGTIFEKPEPWKHIRGYKFKKPGGHDAKLAEGQELPDSLKKLLQKGAKWRFDKHFDWDDGACNLFLILPDETTCVFGPMDSNVREEWLGEYPEGTAGKNWALVGQTGERDYYFVNIEKKSAMFGQVNLVSTQHGPEEEMFTAAPFDNFLDAVEAWSKDSVTKEEPEDEEDPPEYEDLREFQPSKRAKKSAAEKAMEMSAKKSSSDKRKAEAPAEDSVRKKPAGKEPAGDGPLAGKTIAFNGKLQSFSNEEAEAAAKAAGAILIVKADSDQKKDIIVLGKNSGDCVVHQTTEKWTEDLFWTAVGRSPLFG